MPLHAALEQRQQEIDCHCQPVVLRSKLEAKLGEWDTAEDQKIIQLNQHRKRQKAIPTRFAALTLFRLVSVLAL
jgi:hypothetical protein